MNADKLAQFCNHLWDESIVATVTDYIKIPAKSPIFDADWQAHGYIAAAMNLLVQWAQQHAPRNASIELLQSDNRTPVLFIEVPGTAPGTIFLYGHMDKQPEMTGWEAGLGPWTPVMRDGKLYGRGGADDGYSVFAALTAILALQAQNIPHARCCILIEASEESGSIDLPFYMEQLTERLGTPNLIIGLDSGAGNYEQLWNTTSLRGLVSGDLRVEVLTEGVHSGVGSGIVPSSFRIARQLLNRLEDVETGEITLPICQVTIPEARKQQHRVTAQVLGDSVHTNLPFVSNMQPMGKTPEEQLLQRHWKAMLEVVGVEGIPSLQNAGNVLRPYTTLKLSMRTPPTSDVNAIVTAIKTVLESDPPYGARVTFTPEKTGSGWNAIETAPWLEQACQQASTAFFGKPMVYNGEGGSIPFMGMLGKRFPEAQFLITGVLGPNSNAHGPNEFLHVPYAKKLTACVAYVIGAQANQDKCSP